MSKRLLVSGVSALWVMLSPLATAATYHIMVIQEVFAGYAQAPGAQYVILRPQADLQTFVRGQRLTTFDAAGDALEDFAGFCSARTGCDLPATSPACAEGGCPSPLGGNDTPILVATEWARDLFCVEPDLLATGSLPYPDGRVCFGNVGPFAGGCLATGPVDCVAYGQFEGDNGIFGLPAEPLLLGLVLTDSRTRPSQCNAAGLSAAAICVGGAQPNAPCIGMEGECPGGFCRPCPDEDCSALVSSAAGFSQAIPPGVQNFHGDSSGLDGIAGDADGDSQLGTQDINEEIVVIFAAGVRCAVDPEMRGADANLDTRLSAADMVAVIQLVTAGSV